MLKQTDLAVERDVRQAWLDVQSAQANAVSAEASVKAAQSAYDVTALRVSAGKSIVIEQLDALEALVRAKSDLAQSTFDQVLAVAKLNRATGGL
jgi:outer membrane protein TolC